MTTGEDESEPFVAHVFFHYVLARDRDGVRPGPRRFVAQHVNRPSTSDGGEPCAGSLGNSPRRPRRYRSPEGVLYALFGHVNVPGDAYRRGEDEAPLVTVRVSDRRFNVVAAHVVQPSTQIGRTSTPPWGAGTWLAIEMAASRSGASMR